MDMDLPWTRSYEPSAWRKRSLILWISKWTLEGGYLVAMGTETGLKQNTRRGTRSNGEQDGMHVTTGFLLVNSTGRKSVAKTYLCRAHQTAHEGTLSPSPGPCLSIATHRHLELFEKRKNREEGRRKRKLLEFILTKRPCQYPNLARAAVVDLPSGEESPERVQRNYCQCALSTGRVARLSSRSHIPGRKHMSV